MRKVVRKENNVEEKMRRDIIVCKRIRKEGRKENNE
jgi:hypothetical protein